MSDTKSKPRIPEFGTIGLSKKLKNGWVTVHSGYEPGDKMVCVITSKEDNILHTIEIPDWFTPLDCFYLLSIHKTPYAASEWLSQANKEDLNRLQLMARISGMDKNGNGNYD